MIYQLRLGDVVLGSWKSMRSAKAAYNLVEAALRVSKVDFSTIDFALILTKE